MAYTKLTPVADRETRVSADADFVVDLIIKKRVCVELGSATIKISIWLSCTHLWFGGIKAKMIIIRKTERITTSETYRYKRIHHSTAQHNTTQHIAAHNISNENTRGSYTHNKHTCKYIVRARVRARATAIFIAIHSHRHTSRMRRRNNQQSTITMEYCAAIANWVL